MNSNIILFLLKIAIINRIGSVLMGVHDRHIFLEKQERERVLPIL